MELEQSSPSCGLNKGFNSRKINKDKTLVYLLLFLEEPLIISGGTQGFQWILVEKHWSRVLRDFEYSLFI